MKVLILRDGVGEKGEWQKVDEKELNPRILVYVL